MNLYQIDQQVNNIIGNLSLAVDEQTGEIADESIYIKCLNEFEELQITQEQKIENLACYYKNISAEVNAIDNEVKIFLQRKKSKENHLKRIKDYLENFLKFKEIKKIETPKAVLSFRKSEQLEVLDEEQTLKWAKKNNFIKFKEPEIDKTEIKKYLKTTGEVLDFVVISEKQNLQIK